MGLRDRLTQGSNYLRKLRLSRGPDSYFQYKGKREHDRRQTDRARARTEAAAERAGQDADRRREYEERYTREEGNAPEQTEKKEPDR